MSLEGRARLISARVSVFRASAARVTSASTDAFQAGSFTAILPAETNDCAFASSPWCMANSRRIIHWSGDAMSALIKLSSNSVAP